MFLIFGFRNETLRLAAISLLLVHLKRGFRDAPPGQEKLSA